MAVVEKLENKYSRYQCLLENAQKLENKARELRGLAEKQWRSDRHFIEEDIQARIQSYFDMIQLLSQTIEGILAHYEQENGESIREVVPQSVYQNYFVQGANLEQCVDRLQQLTNQVHFLYEELTSLCEAFGHEYKLEEDRELFSDELTDPTRLGLCYRCSCCGSFVYLKEKKDVDVLDRNLIPLLNRIYSCKNLKSSFKPFYIVEDEEYLKTICKDSFPCIQEQGVNRH